MTSTKTRLISSLLFLITTLVTFNAQAGFSVSGTQLRDANGNPFVMRGANIPHAWFSGQTEQSLDKLSRRGGNTARIVLSNGVLWSRTPESQVRDIIRQARAKKLITVLEVHDTTGYGEQHASTLNQAVDYWISIRNALIGQEDYVIINIANEPFGNGQSARAWTDGHRNAIRRLRNAGLNHTLMVDAANWGQDWQNIMRNNARTVFDSDPRRNTIFSVHMYEVYPDDKKVNDYMAAFRAAGLHLVVGEFAADHFGKPVAARAIMARARQYGFGYLGWSWSGNNYQLRSLDIVSNFSNNLTSWGNLLFNDANGISRTSSKATVFNDAPSGVATGRYTLQAMHSGKCLDVSGWSRSPGANLHQWDCHYDYNQQFDISHMGDNTYALRPSHSGLAVDLDWGRTNDGTNILQWSWTGGNNQRWQLRDEGNGYYSIRARNNTGTCMDVEGGSQHNGANIQLWQCNANSQQRWKLIRR